MLFSIKLGEDQKLPEKFQLMRVGKFNSDQYGEFEITKEILQSLKDNYDKNVRGYDDGKLPVDYFHENDKLAAGWIESVELSDDKTELWAKIKWTKKAAEMIVDGELRYLSAEFSYNYVPNEGDTEHGATLFGAGLTNRPFIKNMTPVVNFSEKKLQDEMQACVSALIPDLIAQGHDQEQAIAIAYSKCGEQKQSELKQKTAKLQEGDKMDLEQAKAKIAELEKVIEEMKKEHEGMMADKKKLEEEKLCNEKTNQFNKMLTEGKVVEAQREPFVAGDLIKFAELSQVTHQKPAGTDTTTTQNIKPIEDKIMELAEKIVLEEKLPLHKAINKALADNEALKEEFKKSVN